MIGELKRKLGARKKTKEIEPQKRELINPAFIENVGPVGGVSFRHEKYIATGDGYLACIYVYKYPNHQDDHWLADLANIRDAIVVFDIGTEDQNQVRKNIGKSMEEQSSRYNDPKSSHMDRLDAQQRFEELEKMAIEVSSLGNVMKLLCCRIYVPARTLVECDMAAKEILVNLEAAGYRGSTCLNEGKQDWRAMFLPFKEQQKTLYRKKAQPVPADMLAAGNPFHFTSLSDPLGWYYGETTTSGSILLDFFRVTQMRMSYNIIIMGLMGAGKSHTLKKITCDRACRGDQIRVFDVSGEYRELFEKLGGKIINLDGKSGNIINALQILRTGDNNAISYNRHFSKIATIYRYLNPEAPYNERLMVEKLLRRLYLQWGIVSGSEDVEMLDRDITALPPKEYPIWSDFLKLTREVLQELKNAGEENTKEYALVKNVELVIDNLCDSYGNIFDGHTSIENLYDEQLVCFDITNLGGMKETIFDAQMFNALALCWDNCLAVGSKMKEQYDKKEIDWEKITRSLIIIDEAHRVINARKLAGVEQITLFSREGRKFFSGIALASQSIRDFVPDNASAEGVAQIKTLFELSTYKFVMQQDANCRDKLAEVFQGDFTKWDLDTVPKLEKGETQLAISGQGSIRFKIKITDVERPLISSGGA